jgi:diguanylate cyclase (GGDEF)-like protein
MQFDPPKTPAGSGQNPEAEAPARPDRARERRYARVRLTWQAPGFLPMVALIAGLFIVFIPADALFAARHEPALAAARIAIAAVLVSIGLVAQLWPRRLPYAIASLLVAVLVYAGLFWIRIIVGQDSAYRFTEPLMLIQVGVWFLGGMAFVTAAAVNLAGLVAFVLIELLVIGVPAPEIWMSGLYLGMLGAVAGFAAWYKERLLRRNFTDQDELAAQQHDYRVQATRDGLTGLWNRRAMEEQLERAWKRAATKNRGGAALIIDLDRFKPINDRFGHQAGDEVLIAVARRIQSVLRPSDSVGRLGGDEFLALIRDPPDEEFVRELADRIRRKIESPVRVYLYGDSGTVELTVGVSIGIHRFSGADSVPGDILFAADQDMYRNKEARSSEPSA